MEKFCVSLQAIDTDSIFTVEHENDERDGIGLNYKKILEDFTHQVSAGAYVVFHNKARVLISYCGEGQFSIVFPEILIKLINDTGWELVLDYDCSD